MKRIVELGALPKGRRFVLDGRPFKVTKNLGPAGVAVQSMSKRRVRLGSRTFEAKDKSEQVWSATTAVVIEVREVRPLL